MTISLYRGTSNNIGEALINHIFCKHGPACFLIFDKDQAFLSSVMQYICKTLGIKIKTIYPYNHWLLKTERHIRTISEMITKQLTGTGQMRTHYLQTCTYAYTSFATQH